MNLLAHALLAQAEPDRIVGQLCGDFVRGSDLGAYPAAIEAGIRCHRAIDSYTDKHPLNFAARDLFESPYRRFAGITVDVIYDHFLANDWLQYSDIPLGEYTDLVTRSLQAQQQLLPQGLQRFLGLLESENTLLRNLEREHIDLTLERISRRSKSLAPLGTVAPTMWQHETALKTLFDDFFPQLVSYTQNYNNKFAPGSPGGG